MVNFCGFRCATMSPYERRFLRLYKTNQQISTHWHTNHSELITEFSNKSQTFSLLKISTHSSDESVSAFEVGIGFSVFSRIWKSVWCSKYHGIGISVWYFSTFALFKSMHSLCASMGPKDFSVHVRYMPIHLSVVCRPGNYSHSPQGSSQVFRTPPRSDPHQGVKHCVHCNSTLSWSESD